MVTAATRRDARERAIELLYESHTKAIDVDEIVEALPLTPDDYALELARGVLDHQVELDRILSRYADSRWPVERMAVTDRTVLRLGTFELATKNDVPTGPSPKRSSTVAGTAAPTTRPASSTASSPPSPTRSVGRAGGPRSTSWSSTWTA